MRRSIELDKSAGVPAVRELENESLEVIDGNHRLIAIRDLGWQKVHVENFGPISLAEAMTISRRRNFQWFDDDVISLSASYNDVMVPEFGIEALSEIMPEGEYGIKRLVEMQGRSVDESPIADTPDWDEGSTGMRLSMLLMGDAKTRWLKWQAKCVADAKVRDAASVLDLALRGVLNE